MTLPIHFGPLLDTVHFSARGPETRLSAELPLPEARVLLANLTAAVAAAEAWRAPEGLADLLNL